MNQESEPQEVDFGALIAEAGKQVTVEGRYGHYKDPEHKQYIVESLAIDEATETVRVVYRARYGDGLAWIRTVEDFTAEVDTPSGRQPRFALLSE